MQKALKVKCGNIYTRVGTCIDHIGVIFDTKTGLLLRYGDTTKGFIDYFINMSIEYREKGFNDIINNLILIEFDRYDGALSVDEICTFVNYIVMCSANGEKVFNMLHMEDDDLKKELKKLSEIGY